MLMNGANKRKTAYKKKTRLMCKDSVDGDAAVDQNEDVNVEDMDDDM